jgi:Initiator Replication protein
VLHLTINQKPNGDDFAKAREVIEIRGTGSLTLHDRRVMNILYANAGQKICDDVQHVISLAELRGSHKGGERVKDSIIRLMATIVQVPVAGRNGRSATKRVQVLSDTTTSDDEEDPTSQVLYSFSPGMREIIKDSTLWGRVRTAVIFAFTSKYSLTLYELICARDQPRLHVARGFYTQGLPGTHGRAGGQAGTHARPATILHQSCSG